MTSDCYRTVSEARIVNMLLLAGWAFEVAAGAHAQAAAQSRDALERWIGLGLGFQRSAEGERYFDPVEVANFLVWAGRSGRDSFWFERYVRTGRLLVEGARAWEQKEQFHLTLRRRFNLRAFKPGIGLRLRMPVPLEGAYAGGLEMRPVIPRSLSGAVTCNAGRMEVRVETSSAAEVEFGVDVSFAAKRVPAGGARLAEVEQEIYLRPVEGLVRVSPRVRALAEALAGGAQNPRETLRAFWAYMMDELWCGAIHYDQVTSDAPCDWVLDTRWYDCQIGSALFVSLCRARGIPARIVSGHVLYVLAPTKHFWIEAWLDGEGWVPFDLANWGLALGPHDAAWRDHFFGKIDFRLVTEVLPLAFTGPMSVKLPPRWHMLQTAASAGIDIEFLELGGDMIYRDSVAVF